MRLDVTFRHERIRRARNRFLKPCPRGISERGKRALDKGYRGGGNERGTNEERKREKREGKRDGAARNVVGGGRGGGPFVGHTSGPPWRLIACNALPACQASSCRQRRAGRKTRVARQQNPGDRGDAMLCPARLDPHDVVDEDGEDGDARLARTSIPCAYAWPGSTGSRPFRPAPWNVTGTFLTAKMKTCSSPRCEPPAAARTRPSFLPRTRRSSTKRRRGGHRKKYALGGASARHGEREHLYQIGELQEVKRTRRAFIRLVENSTLDSSRVSRSGFSSWTLTSICARRRDHPEYSHQSRSGLNAMLLMRVAQQY